MKAAILVSFLIPSPYQSIVFVGVVAHKVKNQIGLPQVWAGALQV